MSSTSDNKELKTLNRGLLILSVLIIAWATIVLIYINRSISSSSSPFIVVDFNSGKLVDPTNTNMLHESVINSISHTVNMLDTNVFSNASVPSFEQRDSYNIKDFVIINYFYVEGIVVDKSGNMYTVMYKDHNHVLQKVVVSKDLLISPTFKSSISPISLLID